MGTTTTQLFRTFRIPKSECAPKMSVAYSYVPTLYKVMFKGYEVIEWTGFNENACKVLVEKDSRVIPADDLAHINAIPRAWHKGPKPDTEGSLLFGFGKNVLDLLNYFRPSSALWRASPRATSFTVDMRGKNRKPDFALAVETGTDRGSSSSNKTVSKQVGELHGIVVGKLKTPSTKLGSDLSTASLNALLHDGDYLKTSKTKPFVQLFSYMLRSTKEIGVLTNYDQIRFFKIDPVEKEICMTPLVKIDQVLSSSQAIPHTLQTFLYTESIEDQLQGKDVKKILQVQLDEARRKVESEEKRLKEEEAPKNAAEKAAGASSSSGHKKSNKGSKSGGKHGKHREAPSWLMITPVTRVMDKCEVIGTLGEGICGIVEECDYEGLKVALKVGHPFHPIHDEEDCSESVRNEIEMYEILYDLQGKVIPRMVIGGYENFYTPAATVIITEKVGMAVKEYEDKFFVGEKELGRKEVVALKEKGVEGLKKLHEHGVVHCDAEVRNIRVEIKNGKIDKVWWIDLGHARNIHSRSWFEGENESYEREIDEILEKMK